jgi:hypothetical protein
VGVAYAANTPLLQAQNSTTIGQPDHRLTTTKVTSEAKKLKSLTPKPATATATSYEDTTNSITPDVGSSEWKKERAENERKEQHIKQVIESICRDC